MGETIRLRAADGVELSAYLAAPSGTPRGGLVVVQEIFGVNGHIRRVADSYAAEGFVAIAPALFDRIEPGLQLGYSQDEIQQGIGLKGRSSTTAALQDIAAARKAVAEAGKTGVLGYCWGGYLAWLSATRLDDFAMAVSSYGGGTASVAEEAQMHFGEKDHAIPLDQVEAVRMAHPEVEIYLYPAGHGFNCDERASYDPESARVARERTLAFLKKHVG